MTAHLEVTDLTLNLGKRTILKGIGFTIMPGGFGLLGINGSGKTTLLKGLCARLPITGGRIIYQGEDVTADEGFRAKAFSFAPAIDTLPQNLKAGELISLLADLKQVEPGCPTGFQTAFGLKDMEDRLIGAMSSGMRQRISLCCAFLGNPDVVLLDEPFNWLDPVAAYDLKRELRAYADAGRCVITTLHDVESFVSRCDRGMLIHDGKSTQMFDDAQMRSGRSRIAEMEAEIYALFPRPA